MFKSFELLASMSGSGDPLCRKGKLLLLTGTS